MKCGAFVHPSSKTLKKYLLQVEKANKRLATYVSDHPVILSDDDENSSSSNPQTSSHQKNSTFKRQIAVKRTAPPQPQKNKRDMENINNTTFLSDFNPLNSRREKNKQHRNVYNLQKPRQYTKKQIGSLYDEQGKLKSTGEDICDCFEAQCEGCHMPCEWCSSEKCGLRCRNNRRYMYEVIEYDGKDKVLHNPYLPK